MAQTKNSASDDARITSFAIHPAIGFARVGNAPTEYFMAAEAPGMLPDPDGLVPGREPDWRAGYKDHEGRIKRQACRFRIYGFDDNGEVVREITAADAEITWTVQVANRKAAWYQFNNAMDLGEYAKESLLRNAGMAREDLAITPPARSISGRNTNAGGLDKKLRMTGRIANKHAVTLGELRCDDEGRLVVLPGNGDAKSFADFVNPITTFANNEGWYDDIADGPVRATVKFGRRQAVEAEAAFVVTTPPNYGPGLLGVVTMYDLVLDLFQRESVGGGVPLPTVDCPSFTDDIFPILDRIVKTEWVNEGFFMLFGRDAAAEFTTDERLRRLASLGGSPKAKDANTSARRAVFSWFRDPESSEAEPAQIPPFYGDAFGDFTGLANDELAVTQSQYDRLSQWAKGNFVDDWTGRPKPKPIDRLPVAQQPRALDRAHLDDVLGGPFHPGIEITWNMRRASMWKRPFRLNLLPAGEQPVDDYGPILRPEFCLGPDGPLNANGPGSLTRWMGTPWQTDSASCLAGYDASFYLPIPSFWAARMPNEVLSMFAYSRSTDPKLTETQRQRHFSYRSYWLRDLAPDGNARRQDMVAHWWKLGIIAPQSKGKRPTSANADLTWVETGRAAQFIERDTAAQMVETAERRIGPALDGDGGRRSHLELAAQSPPKGEDTRTVPIANRRRRYGRSDR